MSSTLAGSYSRLYTHPIDTVKARMQMEVKPESAFRVASRLVQKDGFRGLYSGLGITVLGGGPATCLYFTSYELSKHAMNDIQIFDNFGFVRDFCCGFAAECFSCCLWVPIDVLKERMQVQSMAKDGRNLYQGPLHGLRRIFTEEGFTGIYKGYGATLASFGPFSALYLAFYEQFKSGAENIYFKERSPNVTRELPYLVYLGCGGAAGGLASWLTNPMDMVKLRMQVDRGARLTGRVMGGGTLTFNYSSMFSGLQQIVQEGGLRALWKGAATRVAFQMPNTAITISAVEWIKKRLENGF